MASTVFRPDKPWPTAFRESKRVTRLIVGIFVFTLGVMVFGIMTAFS